VQADQWGKKAKTVPGGGEELDFMHFKAGGHKIVAKKLVHELSRILDIPL